jgi:hypothetical protein
LRLLPASGATGENITRNASRVARRDHDSSHMLIRDVLSGAIDTLVPDGVDVLACDGSDARRMHDRQR